MYNTAQRPFLHSCFWSTADWFGEKYQFHVPLNYGACDAHAVFFAVFGNLIASFSSDNMSVHAQDLFNENATKMA